MTIVGLIIGILIGALFSAVIIWIVGRLGLGLEVSGFGPAFIAALVIAVVSWLVTWLLSLLGLTLGVGILAAIVHLVIAAIVLMIAGSGEPAYERYLCTLVAELNLRERVFFLGLITGAQKVSLYQAADVFVLPTLQENFGLVLTEALACGTPLVTTDNGGCRDYAIDQETALVVPARDPDASRPCRPVDHGGLHPCA